MAKIDILIPCYNSADTLSKTLSSITKQSFNDFRVILVDNCSVDNSVKIFKEFRDSRFAVRLHESHVSLGGSLNRCLSYVEADFFCIMHADDEYQHNYLYEMISFMEKNLDVDISHCKSNIIDENSSINFSIKNYIKNSLSLSANKKYSGIEGICWISKYNKIIAPSVFYRNSVLKQKLLFNQKLKFTLDWDFYFQSLRAGLVISKLDAVLFNYRVHPKQQTSHLISTMEKYYEISLILNEIRSYLNAKKLEPQSRLNLYFYSTILLDMTRDIKDLKFANLYSKFKFLLDYLRSSK